jgi:hypothetical protein
MGNRHWAIDNRPALRGKMPDMPGRFVSTVRIHRSAPHARARQCADVSVVLSPAAARRNSRDPCPDAG